MAKSPFSQKNQSIKCFCRVVVILANNVRVTTFLIETNKISIAVSSFILAISSSIATHLKINFHQLRNLARGSARVSPVYYSKVESKMTTHPPFPLLLVENFRGTAAVAGVRNPLIPDRKTEYYFHN